VRPTPLPSSTAFGRLASSAEAAYTERSCAPSQRAVPLLVPIGGLGQEEGTAVEGVSEGGKMLGLVGWKGLVHGARRRWSWQWLVRTDDVD